MTLAAAARVSTALLVIAVGTAGCSSGSNSPAAAPSPSTATTSACPTAVASPSPTNAAAAKGLRSLPADLPMPTGVTPVGATTTSDGVKVVRFTTPSSLRDSVLFILQRYQKAGYVIGRGDAEATEADAPWVHSTVRGLTRVAEVQPCQTLWLIAVVKLTGTGTGTSPLLSPRPTSSVTSALPFG